jgi:hypothetical protein
MEETWTLITYSIPWIKDSCPMVQRIKMLTIRQNYSCHKEIILEYNYPRDLKVR